ncbi:hypothetical protein [Senegalia massiliensis]|uniref:Uncharacterized protein n=1 Tax=Senegalia massiliensis TaxID=1720316 RepID=A0A845QW66_9CLOT|nr:hypothetical protein [Senegalia massiliensis]NBI05398.1 hypothetical protein [Senegalia massiliensis]
MQNYFETNKKKWNERVDSHVKSQHYNVDRFINGNFTLKEIDLNYIGNFNNELILESFNEYPYSTDKKYPSMVERKISIGNLLNIIFLYVVFSEIHEKIKMVKNNI